MAKKDKKIPKERINDESISNSGSLGSTELEKKIFDFPTVNKDGKRDNIENKKPYVVLKYFQTGWECFSDWTPQELKAFSAFLNLLSSHTWGSVYRSGGKGENKSGLGYTVYDVEKMKAGKAILTSVREKLSPDISFFELRVSQKLRVHGFQSQAAFFLVMLDREHKVFP